ncbi:MAG: redox-regulated ATPase YchF [Clostridia bacterium]|nr:redox-regulated ATPase YchF [Clostridia bacterium]MBO7398526.1 redox-regulated ATPase YchF [Clostridia bacterium]MBO7503824.1 redox-regulated ATPase YchF [Clostridia bacterium]MBP5664988.1 redox-regulated ATPase YchF [Clostridia bacterium]
MKLGIVGLPNVGKSTLFNALTGTEGAECANYPFCTIDPNVGIVPVPDERLDVLAKMYDPEKITPATIEFVDIAGLVKGASRGEGLGNKFLANIRESDAVIHVVRCFDDENIIHVDGKVDPVRDVETIELELIFSDIELIERRIERTGRASKSGDKKLLAEVKLLEKLKEHLEQGKTVNSMDLNEEEKAYADSLFLLTSKPVIYAANISENDLADPMSNPYVASLKEIADRENAQMIAVCSKLEEDLGQLDAEERSAFLSELGVESSGLDKLVKASYSLLGLISFLTAGPKEVRAWTIKKNTKAPQAAGKIHSDFERGFIRAEIVAYNDLIESETYAKARERGLVRSEGKDYVMQDGDVTLFRFNV